MAQGNGVSLVPLSTDPWRVPVTHTGIILEGVLL